MAVKEAAVKMEEGTGSSVKGGHEWSVVIVNLRFGYRDRMTRPIPPQRFPVVHLVLGKTQKNTDVVEEGYLSPLG